MIDPIHSLAFSVQANPGVFAILVGSGVSRSARIPTGWEITLDLVRKLASVAGDACGPNPVDWYRNKYDKEPDYSELLDALARTPAERQQLLRGYLEPTDAERNDGLKSPTGAHRSIAALAAKGYIRVIITTNFDRLMETALADAGVAPTVLSSPDQVQGALPLIHTRCCVFKVHGDYLDTRILNTPDELEAYPPEFNALLDQIFDEFGLIVCGWSAGWDTALRDAINRSVSRRFSHFWAVRGEPGDAALRLIQHRQAQIVGIADADGFFSELSRLIEALEQFSRPHPLSTEAAVASLKSYLAEPQYRIRLADLVSHEVDKIAEVTSGQNFALQGGHAPDTNTFTARVRAYEAACETLLAMAVVGGHWCEDWNYPAWQNALSRLAARRGEGGFSLWIDLQRYPATLLFYALGVGAIEAGERGLVFLGKLFATHVHREHREDKTAVELLPALCLFENGRDSARLLEGMNDRRAPLSDWLFALLKSKAKGIVPSEARFTFAFDKLEVLMALGYANCAKRADGWPYWAPPGAYGYRHDNRERILNEIQGSLDNLGDKSPYVRSNIFGHSATACKEALETFTNWAQEFHRRWW